MINLKSDYAATKKNFHRSRFSRNALRRHYRRKERNGTELINGELLTANRKKCTHNGRVNRINYLLLDHLPKGSAVVTVKNSITLEHLNSEPEPDLTVARYREDFYTESNPTPADIYLVIEVSYSTLACDRKVKAPMYAAAGIPEYWIVDAEKEKIEVYRNTDGKIYRERKVYKPTDTLVFSAFNLEMKGKDLLG